MMYKERGVFSVLSRKGSSQSRTVGGQEPVTRSCNTGILETHPSAREKPLPWAVKCCNRLSVYFVESPPKETSHSWLAPAFNIWIWIDLYWVGYWCAFQWFLPADLVLSVVIECIWTEASKRDFSLHSYFWSGRYGSMEFYFAGDSVKLNN